jgi:hypothetical protein
MAKPKPIKLGGIVQRVTPTPLERQHGKREHGQVLSMMLAGADEGRLSVTWWGIPGVPESATQARYIHRDLVESVPQDQLRVSGSR